MHKHRAFSYYDLNYYRCILLSLLLLVIVPKLPESFDEKKIYHMLIIQNKKINSQLAHLHITTLELLVIWLDFRFLIIFVIIDDTGIVE